tara:strand:+ start:18051 stop:19370 length:1320 start_codon:yes stop_codon:yes gene_type:complete
MEIGILLVDGRNRVMGYSKQEGFFRKESFSIKDSEDYISSNTIWFSNLKETKPKKKNIKTSGYFGVELESLFLDKGYILSKKNRKHVLRLMTESLSKIIYNFIDLNKNIELEKINTTEKGTRIKKRFESILFSESYKEALQSLGLKNENILSITKYNDKTRNNELTHRFKKEYSHRENYSNKSKKIKINTLTLNSFSSLRNINLYSISNYKWYNLSNIRDKKTISALLNRSDLMFLKIKLEVKAEVKDDLPKILSRLNLKEIIVTKEEYNWYLSQNWFFIKIDSCVLLKPEALESLRITSNKKRLLIKAKEEMDYKNYELRKEELSILNKKNGKVYGFKIDDFKQTIDEEIKIYQSVSNIIPFNYLQILILNDNFLLNEWIKSQLIVNTLNIVRDLSLREYDIIEYDHKSITIGIENGQEKELRKNLERLELFYPAELL